MDFICFVYVMLQEDMRLQGVPSYGVQQSSSTSYNPYYSQPCSSPSTSSTPYAHHPNFMVSNSISQLLHQIIVNVSCFYKSTMFIF